MKTIKGFKYDKDNYISFYKTKDEYVVVFCYHGEKEEYRDKYEVMAECFYDKKRLILIDEFYLSEEEKDVLYNEPW